MPARYLTPRTGHRLESPLDIADLAATLFEPNDDDSLAVALLAGDHEILGVLLIDRIPIPDAIVEVVEHVLGHGVLQRDLAEVSSVALASKRSSGADEVDGTRWTRLDDICEAAGVELVDWLVVTPTRVSFPRERLGLPSRWPGALRR